MLGFSNEVRNLGFYFDKELSLEHQLKKVKAKTVGNLINISRIAKYLDKNARLKLVHGLILSHLDFSNPLYVGLPNNKLRQLQLLINDSARLVAGLPKFSRERVTPICIDLHLLPIKARITFKICLLTYKALNFGQPAYLRELLHFREQTRTLRVNLNDRLQEPIFSQSNYSNRCFSYCAPRFCNALPDSVRASPSIHVFKKRLKTHLFTQAYDLDNFVVSPDYFV